MFGYGGYLCTVLLLVILVVVGVSACTSTKPSDINARTGVENLLETKITNHAVAFPLALPFDAIVIGVEKTEISKNQIKHYHIKFPDGIDNKALEWSFRRIIDQNKKVHLVTHVQQYFTSDTSDAVRGTIPFEKDGVIDSAQEEKREGVSEEAQGKTGDIVQGNFEKRSDDPRFFRERSYVNPPATTGAKSPIRGLEVASESASYGEQYISESYYNAYNDDQVRDLSVYIEDGNKVLYELKDEISLMLKARNGVSSATLSDYTHIFVLMTGWNNIQYQALEFYNNTIVNLQKVSDENGTDFNPLVVGITWDSVWGERNANFLKRVFHLSSYFNKANDADEVGFTVVNKMINHIIPKSLEELESECEKNNVECRMPKVVAVGHSFGARALSRAIMSSEYLADSDISNGYGSKSVVDLFVGLQGAFDANRFIEDYNPFIWWTLGFNKAINLSEGWPYADYKAKVPHTRWLLTNSEADKTVNYAWWATGAHLVGGDRGMNVMREHKEIFDIVPWAPNATEEKENRVVQLKTSLRNFETVTVVKSEDGFIAGHGDVESMNMARMLRIALDTLEETKPTP